MKTIQELREAKQAIAAGGGRERIDAQHQKNKLTARERLERLFDEGTFVACSAPTAAPIWEWREPRPPPTGW